MKIDLHTHSIASPDGSLTETHYKKMLSGGLDYIAVTDHHTTEFARELHAELGDKVIIGQEITTTEGEIIGLYLKNDIEPKLTPLETVQEIHKQGGLVYIPHPFETVRKGLAPKALAGIAKHIDIIETHNGRAVFQNKTKQAEVWAAAHNVAGAASSDAHGWHGWGRTYSVLAAAPTRRTLVQLLASATHTVGSPGIRGLLYPKVNRIRRKRS